MFIGFCILIGSLVIRRPIVQLKMEVEKFNNMMSGKRV